jgi:serine/threonine protein kinase
MPDSCVDKYGDQDMTGEGAPGDDSPFLAEVEVADLVRRLGKYEILESIGRGGFATVYRARDTVLDRAVALKVLAPHLIWDPEFVARFKQEARVAAHLRHPNIVAIYEIDEVEGQLFIASGPDCRCAG